MNPLIGAGLIKGAADVIGGFFGMSNQDKINKTNIQIARENNAAMAEMQEKKMQFDTEMWEKQNAYNSPLAQRQRLEQAGFNPYMQDVQTGNATSSPTMEMYQPQAAQVDGSGYQQAISMMANAPAEVARMQAQLLQNQQQQTSNKYQELMLLKQLKSMDLGISNQELTNAAQSLMNDFNKTTYDNRVDMLKNDMLKQTLSNSLLQKQLEFLPQEQAMQVARWSADLATIAVQQNLTRSQISNLAAQSGQIKALTEGIKLDNKQKDRLMDYVVNNAAWQVSLTRNQAIKTSWDAVTSKNNRFARDGYQDSHNVFGGSYYRRFLDLGNFIGDFVRSRK